jgi:putative transposase
MAKNRTKGHLRKEATPQRRQSVVEVVVGARDSLFELSIETGAQVLEALLEEDRIELCGPRGRHDRSRQASRFGYDNGAVVLGGRKVAVRKPRVRGRNGGEVRLPTYETLADEDPLSERMYEQMVLGVSTRRYDRSLERMPASVETSSTSKSEVSRKFVARTQAQLDRFLSRPLNEHDIVVVMVDGVHFRDHVMLVALGIDREGHKRVLGLREGTTESEAACRSLLSDLVERGLEVERARLFVIDGGKGIRAAIRGAFGDWALVARCRQHKKSNVLEHLPENKHAWVRASMNNAFDSPTADKARKRLVQLALKLEATHPGAAASLREGLEETVTLNKLELGPALRKTLETTNPIENLFNGVRRLSRNVKRWRGGKMILRWTGTALIEAEKRFRRITGYREMPGLLTSLEALCPAHNEGVCGKELTA